MSETQPQLQESKGSGFVPREPVPWNTHAETVGALNQAVAERDRYRDALERIAVRCSRITAGGFGGLEAARDMRDEAREALDG